MTTLNGQEPYPGQDPLLHHLVLQGAIEGEIVQQPQHSHEQHFVVCGHQASKVGQGITGCHLVFVFLVDRQLLEEDCGQYQQLYVGATQHLDQIHHYALRTTCVSGGP